MTRYTRADWGARAPRGGPGPLVASRVEGLAFHWPAMAKPVRGAGAVCAALRSWQDYHMDSNGWSDIAYQVAVDQDGNRYELRGLRTQSGANGGTDVNQRYGAALLVLAPNEEPTDAMLDEVRALVADFRKLYPGATRLVGHGDIRPEPTACPGPAVTAALRAGAFEPRPKVRRTRGKLIDRMIATGRKARAGVKNPDSDRATHLQRALNWLRRIERKAKR